MDVMTRHFRRSGNCKKKKKKEKTSENKRTRKFDFFWNIDLQNANVQNDLSSYKLSVPKIPTFFSTFIITEKIPYSFGLLQPGTEGTDGKICLARYYMSVQIDFFFSLLQIINAAGTAKYDRYEFLFFLNFFSRYFFFFLYSISNKYHGLIKKKIMIVIIFRLKNIQSCITIHNNLTRCNYGLKMKKKNQ